MEFLPTHTGILILPQKTMRKLKNLNFMNIKEDEYDINSYLYEHNKQEINLKIPEIQMATCKKELTLEIKINNTIVHIYRRFFKNIQPIAKGTSYASINCH